MFPTKVFHGGEKREIEALFGTVIIELVNEGKQGNGFDGDK